MANRYFKDELRTLEGKVIKLFGGFVTTTAGTIGSQASKGFSIAKVGSEVGRYRVALEDAYTALLFAQVAVVGAADAAYGAGGLSSIIRNVNVTSSPAWFDIQFTGAAGVDAEITDGSSVMIEVTLKNTTAY